MRKYDSTHSGQELDDAITAILTRQLDADDIDVYIADIQTGATVAVGSIGGWLEKYLLSS